MQVLYYAPGAASLLVHWLLIELDVPHELRRVDLDAREQKQPGYLALNPAGVVPTLVVDGRPMSEAAAIATWLAEAHPDAGLLPAVGEPAREAVTQWMFHLANAVQPLLRMWWYPWEPAGKENEGATREQVQAMLEAAWQRIDAHLAANGPYLLGDRVSTSDFHLTMLMRWARNTRKPATEWPQLAAHARRMKARPAFATMSEREGLAGWD